MTSTPFDNFKRKLREAGLNVTPYDYPTLPNGNQIRLLDLHDAQGRTLPTAMIYDMGEDGYRLFIERQGRSIAADVQAIIAAGLKAHPAYDPNPNEPSGIIQWRDLSSSS